MTKCKLNSGHADVYVRFVGWWWQSVWIKWRVGSRRRGD